ncbi:MAG: DeoR/GlpR family DNA-binding transcription regulator [Paracoccaceae bacterium]
MRHDRATNIRSFLFEHGLTPVQTLADVVGTSLATMRRDLTQLENDGVIERVHGAAKIAESASNEVAFSQRETEQIDAKRAIASVAISMLHPDSVIFLDAGTTVLQLARLIKLSQMPLTVFTNGLPVAQELMGAPNVTVNLLGGRTRAKNLSVIGPHAETMLEQLWFQTLFLGASAINDALQVSSFDADEARLNTVMTRRATTTCVMADRRKFGQQAPYSVFTLNSDHTLITDSALPASLHPEDRPNIVITNDTDG